VVLRGFHVLQDECTCLLHIYSLLFGGALFCRIILVSRVTGIIEAVGLERVRIALEDGAVVTYAWDADRTRTREAHTTRASYGSSRTNASAGC
jgi:hypothetical protein